MFPVGKGGRCVGLTTLLSSFADRLEIWEPEPPRTLCGLSRPVALPFHVKYLLFFLDLYETLIL
jgi:hypothetical protein